MQSTVVTGLESLSRWRAELDHHLVALGRFMREHELDADADVTALAQLRQRLAAERIIVAFVAEFSRGKSELINAIFFADAGRRILPATPGRTTMCPVELHHDEGSAPMLSLLPIETRLQGLALVELRQRQHLWQQVPLDASNPEALARALQEVTRTQPVTVEKATALGLWSEEDELERPPRAADGAVEVPAWRHAVINYPHPLLRSGLVVIDTPGLNAIGSEPELTLGLLPSAHATVFLLAADTGVTKSDLSVWREHLSGSSLERFVVLNKIDTLSDPMASASDVRAQIESQCEVTARTLDMPLARVFPLSARDALAARVAGDNDELERSRLPALEAALATELMPRQREMLAAAVNDVVGGLRRSALRQLGERRRLGAEQLLELRV
jgi:Dynamin family